MPNNHSSLWSEVRDQTSSAPTPPAPKDPKQLDLTSSPDIALVVGAIAAVVAAVFPGKTWTASVEQYLSIAVAAVVSLVGLLVKHNWVLAATTAEADIKKALPVVEQVITTEAAGTTITTHGPAEYLGAVAEFHKLAQNVTKVVAPVVKEVESIIQTIETHTPGARAGSGTTVKTTGPVTAHSVAAAHDILQSSPLPAQNMDSPPASAPTSAPDALAHQSFMTKEDGTIVAGSPSAEPKMTAEKTAPGPKINIPEVQSDSTGGTTIT